ncbi:MAG TPA: NAD(P)/FAD-dependent oxidoreductase [Gaiella sp.]|nr:NAD(P)/FAD-dependent oxidoreductase [Gaiella sp.]
MRAEVAVVGNGVAGYACAARLAKHGIRPLLIGPGLPVDRPPLTKAALADGRLRLLADEEKLAERGIDHLDGLVVQADLDARRPSVDTGQTEIDADTVVLATGLRYRKPPIPGVEAAHVNANPTALEEIGAAIAGGARRVVVIGAGLIGTESAATLATAGHDVTVVDLLERPLERLHDPLPSLGAEALAATGAEFHGGVAITELRQATGQVTVCCNLGELTAELVLAATGGVPLVPPGLAVDAAELPLAVDSALRVPGHERVHAVGDLVVVPHARFGPMQFPHWDMAIGTGEHAADAIAGIEGDLDRLPYWWTDIGPRTFAEVGWADAAVEWGNEQGMHVGYDESGVPVAALVVDEPRRLREARVLLTG